MTRPLTIRPIGRVVGGRTVAVDDNWDDETATIELDPTEVEAGATDGLADFSHVEVVFFFDQVDEDALCRGSRHPRGRTDWPSVGILAQRAKDRPNRIGVTVCRVVGVGPHSIEVAGLDAIDGTPVLDVKPYVPPFDTRADATVPEWMRRLMEGYF